ncbi:MAG: HD domain-containing protein [Actinobacteria bacterium]|jgi:(p)ppGpp synthase/HD superfamily hydrolase|nr:HD domain-containing protein [Actinomycetota bacterium]
MTQNTRIPSTFLTHRFTQAVAYASALHATQVRKDSDIPYISHLLAVAGSVIEAGGDEDMAIAALLHDAAEDQGGEARVHDIGTRFGARVAAIVRGCSDTLVADRAHKEEYGLRKSKYVAHLKVADLNTVVVATADKLHNARAILTDLQIGGEDTLEKFTGSKQQILDYYTTCLSTAKARGVPEILTVPLDHAVSEIASLLSGGGRRGS